mgnify:CR=1 FL=1
MAPRRSIPPADARTTLDVFITRKAAIDALLAHLAAHSADHFGNYSKRQSGPMLQDWQI